MKGGVFTSLLIYFMGWAFYDGWVEFASMTMDFAAQMMAISATFPEFVK